LLAVNKVKYQIKTLPSPMNSHASNGPARFIYSII